MCQSPFARVAKFPEPTLRNLENAVPSIETPDPFDPPRSHHTCPVWVGWFLASPLRRLVENPITLLGSFVEPGSIVIDVGSAMGFHSLDLARLVGPSGRVISLDVQQAMLDGLVRRARRKRLDRIIEPRLCSQENLGIDDLGSAADLVTAFNVVHETAYPRRLLAQCAGALVANGHLFLVEPRGHVSRSEFGATVGAARSLGLIEEPAPRVWRSHSAVFSKPS
jgi:SAM-dependent methyltransferase